MKARQATPSILLLSLFLVVLVRTAWVSDDAYISFRTVDHFVHGNGLTWNPGERVQAYTHPAWLFLMSAGYWLTGEIYYTGIAISLAVSLAALALFAFRLAPSPWAAVCGLVLLLSSKAFVDYSTSGLENPLSHLLTGLFLLLLLGGPKRDRDLFGLALVASLIAVTRLDLLLVCLPGLAWALYRRRGARAVGWCAAGLAPLAAWELFSLFYYGFLFPNTAYAKLMTGIPRLEYLEQGLFYLLNSIWLDPLCLAAIAAAIVLGLRGAVPSHRWVAAGVVLYLVYVVYVGGDFMSGRFLTVPLFAAVTLLAREPGLATRSTQLILAAVVFAFGLTLERAPMRTGSGYGADRVRIAWRDDRGIADERAIYFQMTGLLNTSRSLRLPEPPFPATPEPGAGTPVVVLKSIGIYGYQAGGRYHVVDSWALGDALLARLPVKSGPWRIGHFRRSLPAGYIETLETGVNRIVNPQLAAYYDHLRLIIRGPLWSAARWRAIWKLNVGGYAETVAAGEGRRLTPSVSLAALNRSARAARWDTPGNIILDEDGVEIRLGSPSRRSRVGLNVDGNDVYELIFLRGAEELAAAQVGGERRPNMTRRVVSVPAVAVRSGYDRLRLRPVEGDGRYAVSFVALMD